MIDFKNLNSNFGHVFNGDALETDTHNYQVLFETDGTKTEVINFLQSLLKKGFVGFEANAVQFRIISLETDVDGINVTMSGPPGTSIYLVSYYEVNGRKFWGTGEEK